MAVRLGSLTQREMFQYWYSRAGNSRISNDKDPRTVDETPPELRLYRRRSLHCPILPYLFCWNGDGLTFSGFFNTIGRMDAELP